MAIKRLVIDGFGQVELNNVAFRRDGRIEAQCAPYVGTKESPADFAGKKVENGMIVVVNKALNRIELPSSANAELPHALVYSTEHMYDERARALKNFALNSVKDFFPRVGYFAKGDCWTSNTICYDDTDIDDSEDTEVNEAVLAVLDAWETTPVYGCPDACGAIKVSTTKPNSGLILKVVKSYTMPDGTYGAKFQVIACD